MGKLKIKFTFIFLLSILWPVKAVLRCHNCFSRNSNDMEDCVPSPGEFLLDKLPRNPGLYFSNKVQIPNVCLKMVTITESKSGQEDQTILRMGANMGHLTQGKMDERLKILDDLCTFKRVTRRDPDPAETTILCGCTTDYCNGQESFKNFNSILIFIVTTLVNLFLL